MSEPLPQNVPSEVTLTISYGEDEEGHNWIAFNPDFDDFTDLIMPYNELKDCKRQYEEMAEAFTKELNEVDNDTRIESTSSGKSHMTEYLLGKISSLPDTITPYWLQKLEPVKVSYRLSELSETEATKAMNEELWLGNEDMFHYAVLDNNHESDHCHTIVPIRQEVVGDDDRARFNKIMKVKRLLGRCCSSDGTIGLKVCGRSLARLDRNQGVNWADKREHDVYELPSSSSLVTWLALLINADPQNPSDEYYFPTEIQDRPASGEQHEDVSMTYT